MLEIWISGNLDTWILGHLGSWTFDLWIFHFFGGIFDLQKQKKEQKQKQGPKKEKNI